MRHWIAALGCAAVIGGCGGGGAAAPLLGAVPLILSAGMVPLEPEPVDLVSATVNLKRLGIGHVESVFDLTTPPGEQFTIQAFTRTEQNSGAVSLCVAHCSDGGFVPSGGPESLGNAGVVPFAAGAVPDGPWLEVTGDGYARMTVRGAIEEDQVLAICAESAAGKTVSLVRLRLGGASIINGAGSGATLEDDYPGVIASATLYSSDSWQMGLPVVAADGDATHVVVYDGSHDDPFDWRAFEVRLRHDAVTNSVVAGGSTPLDDPNGGWRDHAVAAKGVVVAIARADWGGVTLRLSFDGGATFAQMREFPLAPKEFAARLVQLAIGADGRIAMLYWKGDESSYTDLVLVEGTVSARSAGGEPTAYAFGAAEPLFRGAGGLMPLIIGAQYSEAGDLVVGYAFTSFDGDDAAGGWTATTETRCATRLAGGASGDVLVEIEDVTGFDPSVALVGSGDTMRVFLAYEAGDGVRMKTSADGGRTFSEATVAGGMGANMPNVFARMQQGELRVDLIYLMPTEIGNEIHLRHWHDFGATPPTDHRLVKASLSDSGNGGGGTFPPPLPPWNWDPSGPGGVGGDPGQWGAPDGTWGDPSGAWDETWTGSWTDIGDYGSPAALTQVSWFGYGAALSGDDVVIVFQEEVLDFWGIYGFDLPVMGPGPAVGANTTGPVPAPDEADTFRLKLIRID